MMSCGEKAHVVHCIFQIFFSVTLTSVRIEKVKNIKYIRCGIASSKGTYNGMLRNVGRRTVRAGTDNIRFDG